MGGAYKNDLKKGGAAPSAPPLNPPMVSVVQNIETISRKSTLHKLFYL